MGSWRKNPFQLQSTYVNSDLERVSLPLGMTTPWMDAVASLVQKSHASVIPNTGHMTMIEAAQAVNEAIQGFAVQTPSSSKAAAKLERALGPKDDS
jgi:hypothetical protein